MEHENEELCMTMEWMVACIEESVTRGHANTTRKYSTRVGAYQILSYAVILLSYRRTDQTKHRTS